MKIKTRLLIIATDGYPLEQITGKWYSPIVNFIRRWRFGKYKQCKKCYEDGAHFKVSGENNNF